jgi:hypothetical protein
MRGLVFEVQTLSLEEAGEQRCSTFFHAWKNDGTALWRKVAELRNIVMLLPQSRLFSGLVLGETLLRTREGELI